MFDITSWKYISYRTMFRDYKMPLLNLIPKSFPGYKSIFSVPETLYLRKSASCLIAGNISALTLMSCDRGRACVNAAKWLPSRSQTAWLNRFKFRVLSTAIRTKACAFTRNACGSCHPEANPKTNRCDTRSRRQGGVMAILGRVDAHGRVLLDD